ncbi:MAG: hypothetical protein PHI97_05920 [Desulfobulbus sp.]|nr:hypothetical protein [Desulfobulbus sp.]
MHPFPSFQHSLRPIIQTAGLVLICISSVQTALAEDEIRAGAVIQIPFTFGGSSGSPVDFSGFRVGLTCQYAEVEEDIITSTHHVTNTYLDGSLIDTTENTSITGKDEGNRAYGVEGNIFFDILDGFTPSAEVLGFYGTNEVQGAIGGGYDFSSDFFLDAKVMFPYSEIGVRFPGQVEIYGGLKTLGSFNPKKEHRLNEEVTDTNTYTPPPPVL